MPSDFAKNLNLWLYIGKKREGKKKGIFFENVPSEHIETNSAAEQERTRRNLPAYERARLALRLKPVIAEKAKEKQESGVNQYTKSLSQNSVKPSAPIDTQKELAKIAGVSHDTIAKTETDSAEQAGKAERLSHARECTTTRPSSCKVNTRPEEQEGHSVQPREPQS